MPYEPLPVAKALESLRSFPRLSAISFLKQQRVRINPPGDVVTPPDLLYLWIADELHVAEPQRTFVLNAIQSRLHKWARVINNMPEELGPMLQLIFTDNRYFAYTGVANFIDLETGEEVVPSRPPATSLAYNLAEIFARRYHRATHADQHPATPLEGA